MTWCRDCDAVMLASEEARWTAFPGHKDGNVYLCPDCHERGWVVVWMKAEHCNAMFMSGECTFE